MHTNFAVVDSINVSDGGVPKLPCMSAAVRMRGLEGDRHRHPRIHGGPARAVCLYSLDLIEALRKEGHPITPGSIGENITITGVPWTSMTPNVRLDVGVVSLELTGYADPCRTIAGSFQKGQISRVSARHHPGWSRLYARVVKPGRIAVGDPVTIHLR